MHKSVIVALRKLVILFVTLEDNRWIQYSLVLFVLGDGPEKVWIVIPVVAGDTSLGTVADNHRPKSIIINHHQCCH